jgi:hypothetical protein
MIIKALLTAALTVGLTVLAHAAPSAGLAGAAVSPGASAEQAGSPNQPPLGGPTFATSPASPAPIRHYHSYHYAHHHMHHGMVAP